MALSPEKAFFEELYAASYALHFTDNKRGENPADSFIHHETFAFQAEPSSDIIGFVGTRESGMIYVPTLDPLNLHGIEAFFVRAPIRARIFAITTPGEGRARYQRLLKDRGRELNFVFELDAPRHKVALIDPMTQSLMLRTQYIRPDEPSGSHIFEYRTFELMDL